MCSPPTYTHYRIVTIWIVRDNKGQTLIPKKHLDILGHSLPYCNIREKHKKVKQNPDFSKVCLYIQGGKYEHEKSVLESWVRRFKKRIGSRCFESDSPRYAVSQFNWFK